VVACGKETDPTFELFSQYADAAIHIGALKAAFSYQRAKRKWYALRSPPPEVAPLTLVRERRSPLMGRVRAALETSEAPKDGPPPELLRAAAIIKELGERMPDQPLSKSRIVRALSIIQEFTPTYQAGLRPWFGHKNFAAMMRRLSQIQPAIEVTTLGKNKVETVWREPAEAPPPKPKTPPPVDDEPEARLLPRERERTPLALLAEAAKDVDLPDPVEDTAEEAPEEDPEDEDAEAEGMTSRV